MYLELKLSIMEFQSSMHLMNIRYDRRMLLIIIRLMIVVAFGEKIDHPDEFLSLTKTIFDENISKTPYMVMFYQSK